MKKFESFDNKAIIKKPYSEANIEEFNIEIFNNEVVWTYLAGEVARNNPEIYKMITLFNLESDHSIYFEGQPISPYIKIEGNSYIDSAMGALNIRGETQSGISYSKELGNEVCFVEAKYLSDLSTKTEHFPIRNQMERVIENLLNLNDNGIFPKDVVFTLLTPRIFKNNFGSRMYSFKYYEYESKLGRNNNYLASLIELTNEKDKKRSEYSKVDNFIINRLSNFKINWVTFEEIFEKYSDELENIDITKSEDALKTWKCINKKLLQKKIEL